jgi:Astacin (Peptidase family M12A)
MEVLSGQLQATAALLRSASDRLDVAGKALHKDQHEMGNIVGLSPTSSQTANAGPTVPSGEAQEERFSDSILREIADLRQSKGVTDEEALLIARQLKLQEEQIARADAVRAVRESRGENLDPNEAYALNSAVWSRPVRIPVYFENATESEVNKECQWIRAAIERTWQQAADMEFTEWKPLPNGAKGGIRIFFQADAHPHCNALGRHINGLKHGMILSNTFTGDYNCPISFRTCIEEIAIHEFGHALGFAHEQNRSDAPVRCQNERQGSDGDYPVTIYDPRSIMNYCNPRWNNDGVLSPLDKEAVVKLYGPKP